MSLLHQGLSFLRHLSQAGDAHDVHSPFLFKAYQAAERAAKQGLGSGPWLEDKAMQSRIEAGWKRVEAERRRLLRSTEWVEVTDFGAGSLVSASKRRRLGALAASGLLPASWGRRLGALRMHLPPGPVLELGTSLGITSAYLASLPVEGSVVTLEGCSSSLAQAQTVWQNLGLADRITSIQGNIDDTLTEALRHGPFSLVILDANHRSGPVRRYSDAILPHIHPDGALVLDDIYWTPDMTEAWNDLQRRDAVRQSIDLYRQGWLFFRQSQARERFVLRALL